MPAVVSLVALALFVASCTDAPEVTTTEARRAPNVVLISIDTLRPDRLSSYGHQRQTSPTIDRLARRGSRFANAFSTAPWTLPAHASMLSGRYPSSLTSRAANGKLYLAVPMLSSMLKKAGYTTGAVTGGGYVSASYGADEGFDFFVDTEDPRAATKWLAELPPDSPYFLFFHTYVAHTPYRDDRYAKNLDPGRLKGIYEKGWGPLHLRVSRGETQPTEQERAYLLALYDGGVARADEYVDQILSAAYEVQTDRDTVVILTSDHGEEFWEHTGRGAYHGHTLYAELTRIPLIWVDPALPSPPSAISAPVSLVDIVPTLAARIGFGSGETFDGENLLPLLSGTEWTVQRALFAEATKHGPPRRSVRTRDGKLIFTDGTTQLGEGSRAPVPVLAPTEVYAIEDTQETANIAESHGPLRNELLELLHTRPALESSADAVASPVLDSTTREKLRALGYLDDASGPPSP